MFRFITVVWLNTSPDLMTMNPYLGYFSDLFARDFMPHGHCYRWLPDVLWTNVLGDAFTVFAYFAIPVLLLLFVKKRKGMGFTGIFIAFAAFIVSCGIVHLMAIISVWVPIYRAEGFGKVVMATISMGTVGMLAYNFKNAMNIPLPEEMKEVQTDLEQEIDERAKMQRQIEFQKKQLEMFIKYTPAAVAMFDKEIQYLMASDRWYTDYGLDPEVSILGRSHYDVFPEIQGMDEWKAIHQRALQGETVTTDVDEFPREDGSMLYLKYEVRPWYDQDGAIGGIIMFTEVITKRVVAELALKDLNQALEAKVTERTAELQNAVKELEGFNYTVSHDLRSPLRAIIGFSGFCLKKKSEKLDEESLKWLNIIHSNAERMDELIVAMLELSKSGRGELLLESVNMKEVFDEAWGEVVDGNEGLKIELKLGELPDAVSDRTGIYRVWNNLLSNAVKYSSKQEQILIEVGSIVKDDNVQYFVRDNGSGFDSKYADKLFEPFKRLHTDEDFEGNGIGLATASNIIERSGGRIWAESSPGNGATFYFTLKLKH